MAKIQSPQLGYNTNVRHKGRLFHIQTEDSGINRPHIITHLFVDGGRILKSVKSSYADSLEEPDLANFVRRRMQEQHKAMFVALRDGHYDALIDPSGSPEVATEVATEVPEPRATVPPEIAEPTATIPTPTPRPSPSPPAHPSTRTTGRTPTRSTGAHYAVPVPGGAARPPAVEAATPDRAPVFSSSMRYTSPRMVLPAEAAAMRERTPVVTETFVREHSLDEVILALLVEELSA